jgi:DNA-binding response OmpR family regulator
MHMKRVLISSDDAHTRALVSSALESLDVTISECTTGELHDEILAEGLGLLVIDAAENPAPLVEMVEHGSQDGLEARLLLLIEPDALGDLRLPTSIPADFVVRGSSSDETSARARALLWPGEEAEGQELVRVDDLTVNLATYQAYLRGEPLDFTYLEYALFSFLVTHPNRAYTRDVLLRRVWGADYYGGTRTVDVHIRRIRAKIGPELSARLETVRNVGYLWRG